MKQKIRFGKSTIQYGIIKSKRRKTSEIRVDENGVEIRTPLYKRNSEIREIIKEKSKWIYKKQIEYKQQKKVRKNLRFKIKLKEMYLEKRAKKLASKIGIKPTKIVVKPLKNRWGSATKTGTINLNSNLLKCPKDIIDYIIIHELCHLKIKDHSFRFWNLVRKFMPNYVEKKEWLEMNSKSVIHSYKL